MSKSLAVWMYLSLQKSQSRRLMSSQTKIRRENAGVATHQFKIAKIRGDLTTLFDRFPVHEAVKANQLINLYHGADLEKEQRLKKDAQYHQSRSAQVPTGRLISVSKRISHKIAYNSIPVSYERRSR